MRRLTLIFLICWALATEGQLGRGTTEWSSTGADAHRSSWVRNDAKISRENIVKPGNFQFLWKQKLDAKALSAPTVLLNGYIGYRGFRSLGFTPGSSDAIYGMDTDLGRVEWVKRFTPVSGCAAGTPASVARAVNLPLVEAPPRFGGGGGRGSAAKSSVGEPGLGAVTVPRPVANPAPPAAPPSAASGGPPAFGGGGQNFTRPPIVAYGLSSDGMLHTMYASDGMEPDAAIRFLPANALGRGLVIANNTAYAASSKGCGAKDGVWALNLESKQVSHWDAKESIAGTAGFSIGPDGTVYVAASEGALLALDGKTMQLRETFIADSPFVSDPVVFGSQGKTYIAASTKDGIHIVDPAGMKPVVKAAGTGLLSSWQDTDGTRWIVAVSASKVAGLKFADGKIEPGWSHDLASAAPPLIVNGVVFVVTLTKLYAYSGSTGAELWNSGTALNGVKLSLGPSGGGGQVYVAGADGVLYAFGYPLEH